VGFLAESLGVGFLNGAEPLDELVRMAKEGAGGASQVFRFLGFG
jgi:hypothetical protein